tara:strand:- start:4742 stop:5269 length:528 start_codon:yes stop_codon:yes gene_type:complete
MSTISNLIKTSGAIKYGTFKLASGVESSYYIDKYLFETQPEVLGPIADKIAEMLSTSKIDVIAGPELGAVPLVTAVSLRTGIPAAFIRKNTKGHGTQSRVEGNLGQGQSVALLEDVTTTGSTMLDSIDFIEAAIGANISRLIVVVDRNEGATENFNNKGFDLEYLAQIGTDIAID